MVLYQVLLIRQDCSCQLRVAGCRKQRKESEAFAPIWQLATGNSQLPLSDPHPHNYRDTDQRQGKK